ncbi:MAG: cysteine desulfurase family protein [Gemmataceae bacterium]
MNSRPIEESSNPTTLIPLDAHATTPLHPAAAAAMQHAWTVSGNPSSSHQGGRAARRLLETAREQVAELLSARPDEVFFTSGATESNNLALFGLAPIAPAGILAAAIEHPCVLGPIEQLAARGHTWHRLGVDRRGAVIAPAELPPGVQLATLMLANHETGTLQPIEMFRAEQFAGLVWHCDAAQALGKIPVQFHTLGAATLAGSAHKFGGPPGAGLLLVRHGTLLRPHSFGGHQERGRRPGTENVPAAVGLAAALTVAISTMQESAAQRTRQRQWLLDHLRAAVAPVVLNGPEPGAADGLPSVLNIAFPGCRADVLLMRLDLAGVCCSTGSACSSGSLQASPVLRAMNVPPEVLQSALRFSFPADFPEELLPVAAARIVECVRAVRGGGTA